MGKSYQKYNPQESGSKRFISRENKHSKTSMHGSNCNKKTCGLCHRHSQKGRSNKKYYDSKSYLTENH